MTPPAFDPDDTHELAEHARLGEEGPLATAIRSQQEFPPSDRLDFIRNRRRELAAKRTLMLLVPGYQGEVGVRYRALPREEISDWQSKLSKRDASLEDNIDLLIRCCDEILVRQSWDDGSFSDWMPIDPQVDPTTFSTANLAQLVGGQAGSAREEVKALFSPGGSQPLAPESHTEPLIGWQQDVDFQIDRTLLGE